MPHSPAPNPPTRPQLGLTLLEVLVTMAIAALLATLAVPSLRPLIERWRTTAAAATLQAALQQARTEGIRRGGGLVLSRRVDTECPASQPTAWSCGWQLHSASLEDRPLQTHPKGFPGLSITPSAAEDRISIDRWGVLSLGGEVQRFDFLIAPENRAGSPGRRLCVLPAGAIQQIPGAQPCA